MDRSYSVSEAAAEPVCHSRQALPETAFSHRLDRLLTRLAAGTSWVWLLLMLVIVANVLLRYLFGEGRVELEELQWHLFAIGWLVGLSYGVVHNAHIRVDLVYERLSVRRQAWVELVGICCLLLPLVALVLWYVMPFVSYSWQLGEISVAPGGLPYRWLIKTALLVGFALLAVAVLSRLSRVSALLLGVPRALKRQEEPNGSQ